MGKLIKMRVYLHGLRGVGMEVAKNVCLAGPASLTLHDPEPVALGDLGSTFYFT
jgi:ubiquitin-activating enzyme E1